MSKTRTPHPSLLITFVIALLTPATLAQTTPATTPSPTTQKLPFTISKETTRLTAPLRPDGTVDYLAALNQKYSKNVTPENNAFVAWLQILGTGDNVLLPKTKAQILQLAGTKELPPNTSIWEGFPSYMQRSGRLTYDAATDDLTAARHAPWRAQEHPDLADFLILRESLLSRAALAADRLHWWGPAVPENGKALADVPIPSLATFRGIANTFLARALLRASSGNFDGCLADIKSVRQIARQIGSGPDPIERLVGFALEDQATATLASVALPGNLTEAQCQTAAAALDQLSPLPAVVESIDIQSRWIVLDMLQWAALDINPEDPAAKTGINSADVDWDIIFIEANAFFDEYVHATNDPDLRHFIATSHALEKRTVDLAVEAHALPQNLARIPGEAHPAYTHRIGALLLHTLYPAFGKAEELYRRANQQTQMTRLLLAAAHYKARTNNWPKTLDALVPAYLPELPKDIYSQNESQPFRYLLTPNGPRIYSLGENARDDNGIRDSATQKDDLAIGAP